MISHLDHFVLTVQNMEKSVNFYTQVLGMELRHFGAGRIALHFGQSKINLHQAGQEFEPKAQNVHPGSADLCFVLGETLEKALEHIKKHKVPILMGPIERSGARGKICSIYLRDPDGNLIELSTYL